MDSRTYMGQHRTFVAHVHGPDPVRVCARAMPPAATANGKLSSAHFAFPYQPTRFAVTMKVPAAKP